MMRFLVWVLPALLLGCGLGRDRPVRPPGSALWVDPARGSLEGSQMARLKEEGVTELFLEAVRLGAGGAPEKVQGLEALSLPPGAEATLVVTGQLPDEVEPIADLLAEIRWTIENQGLVPRGVHLDLALGEDPDRAARRAADLREALPPGTLVSGAVPVDRIGDDTIAPWLEVLDFLTVRLYGQTPGSGDDPTFWSFEHLRRRAEAADALGRPWLLETVTLGRLLRLDRSDRVIEEQMEVSPIDLLWNRRLELRAGFSLDASNRRTYTLEARGPTRAGAWTLSPGEAVRIVRPATSDLEALLRLFGALDLDHHLGHVFLRLPAPSEGLSLSPANLANALNEEAASPDLHAGAAVQRRAPGAWLFRFTLENRNEELTELSLLDNNFLEVRTDRGSIGKVDAGDFYRYDLFRARGKDLERTFRDADVLRMHLAILSGQQGVQTGEVEIRTSSSPTLSLSGRFLLPDGRTVEIEEAVWSDGELHEPAAPVAVDGTAEVSAGDGPD